MNFLRQFNYPKSNSGNLQTIPASFAQIMLSGSYKLLKTSYTLVLLTILL